MKVFRKVINVPFSNGFCHTFFPIGDVHWEAKGCDRVAFRKTLKELAETPNSSAVLMGDVFDCIGVHDKRHFPGMTREDLLSEMDSYWESAVNSFAFEIESVSDKLIGILEGNHERKIAQTSQVNVISMLCNRMNEKKIDRARFRKSGPSAYVRELEILRTPELSKGGIKNFGYNSILILTFRGFTAGKGFSGKPSRERNVVVWLHHGAGGGRGSGTALNKLETAVEIFPDADIYVMGHVHKAPKDKRDYLCLNKNFQVVSKTKVFVVAQAYLQNYISGAADDYSERFMHAPAHISHTKVKIYPFNNGGDVKIKLEF